MLVADEGRQLIGLGTLAKVMFQGGDLSAQRDRLLERIARDGNDANALMDLSTILQLMGHRECGLSLQALALKLQQVYHLAPSGHAAGIRLLSISCPGDLSENNALEFLLEGSDIALDTLYVSPDIPLPARLPDYDVAMVAICESDRNRPLLAYAASLIEAWPQKVLCAPSHIAVLSRDSASILLRSVPGAVMPLTRRLTRSELSDNGSFPLVARPVDSHKGLGLKRIDTSDSVSQYLTERAEAEFYVAPYIDFSGPDGQFRKYRVVFIGGAPYVCHVAISSDWIVHYLSSGMVESGAKRAEEARCFETFDEGFASRHQSAFDGICERVKLEYFGIDCAETREGQLLVFEVDSGMTVHAMDPVDVFPYKQPQMLRVFAAFRRMLEAERASQHEAGIEPILAVV